MVENEEYQFELSNERIAELSKKYNMQIDVMSSNVIVKTLCASWRIDYTEKPYIIYHRPVLLNHYKSAINTNDGYHKQNKSFDDMEEVLNYIYTHDKDMFKKRRPKQKRKRGRKTQ